MPRKPVIQTMVATSIALSGTAKAETSETVEILSSDAIHSDILETEFPDHLIFGEETGTLIYGDGDVDLDWTAPELAQAKSKGRDARKRVKGRTTREGAKTSQKGGGAKTGGAKTGGAKTGGAKTGGAATDKGGRLDQTRRAREGATGGKTERRTGTAGISESPTVSARTGRDSVGGISESPTISATTNRDAVTGGSGGLKSSGGTRLRSGSGGGIKLRNQD